MRERPRWVTGITVALLVVAAVGAGGAASAVWQTSGTGTGSSTTDTTAPITLSGGVAAAGLYPNGTSEVRTTATNPNSASVRILSLALDTTQGTSGFAVSGDTPSGGCPPSSFRFTSSSAGWDLPPNATVDISLPGAVRMISSAASACQGATVTVFLRAGS